MNKCRSIVWMGDGRDGSTVRPCARRRGRVPLFACLLLLVLSQTSVFAQEDSEQAPTEADRERLQQLEAELARRQSELVELQSEHGVYAPVLIEAYADLAVLHAELSDLDSASSLYQDALQIARINSGLYSERQLPLIAQLIGVNSSQAAWQEVDDLEHLSLHISSRLYDSEDPRYLSAFAEFGEWRLRVVNENLLELGDYSRMTAAEELSGHYAETLNRIADSESVPTEALAELLYGKTRVDLAVARSVAETPYSAFTGTESRYVSQTRCRNVTNNQGQVVRQCYQVQVENPRYLQSQRDAKRFALNRYTREINENIAQLTSLSESDGFEAPERERLVSQIEALEVETEQLRRSARRALTL